MPQRESYASRLLWSALVPGLMGIIVLLVEYRSGFFQRSMQSEGAANLLVPSSIITILLLMTSFIATQAMLIWLRPYKHTREAFALAAFCVGVAASLVLVLSAISGLVPWSAVYIFIHSILRGNFVRPSVKWADFACLVLLYFMLLWWLAQSYSRWPGRKSLQQYEREQRNEAASLGKEALLEMRRIVRRQPPFRIYDEPNTKDFLTQLEPVNDSLAWRDQARELVRLSSSSYSFDADADWHDNEGCWIGTNVDTGELVLLLPRQDGVSVNELQRGITYAKTIATKRNLAVGEMIIATREKDGLILSNKPEGILIRNVHEAELLEQLVDFRDYFNEIKKRATTHKLQDSALTLNEIYVPSHFCLTKGAKSSVTVETYLNDWLNDPSQRQIALLGEYGQGKSTAALMWAFHQIEAGVSLKRVPLVIELRGTSPRNLTPLGLLGAWASKFNINPQGLMRLLVAGRLTLIFEGFDEMSLVGDATMRLSHFRTLWDFAYPKAKILITGRPNFFLDEEEMKAALGINKPLGGNPYCQAMRLEPFDVEQIRDALRAYDADVKDQIHKLVQKNERFKDIVSRPSLLQIVAVLWQKERLSQKVDELTSAFVMDLFVRQSYRRQGLKDKDFPGIMALTTAEREYFMLGIASLMASQNLPNQISGSRLNQTIRELLATVPDSVSTKIPTIIGESIQPLTGRIQNTDLALEHLMTDVRACGLLVDDPSNPGTFRFGHKSFMEYLFAAVIAELIQKPDSERARAIVTATAAKIEDILTLPVAIDFLSELLSSINTVGGKDGSTSLAKHLLKKISGKGVIGKTRRLQVFLQLFGFLLPLRLSGKHKRVRSFLRIVITARTFSLVLMMVAMFFIVRMTFLPSASILVAGLLFITTVFAMAVPLIFRSYEKGVLLWLTLCRGMNVDAATIHRAAGTWFVPKINQMSPYGLLKDYQNRYGDLLISYRQPRGLAKGS